MRFLDRLPGSSANRMREALQEGKNENVETEHNLRQFFEQLSGIEDGEGNDISGETVKNYLQKYPELLPVIDKLMSPDLSSDECGNIVSKLNEDYYIDDRGGSYQQVRMTLPNGDTFKMKIYLNMDNALSFGWVRKGASS